MANELQTPIGPAKAGLTVYTALVCTNSPTALSVGRYWNTVTPALEAFVSGNWASYKVALTETIAGVSGIYVGTAPPALPAGDYALYVYSQNGGTAAATDAYLGEGTLLGWNGTVPQSLGQLSVDGSGRVTAASVASVTGSVGSVVGSVGSVAAAVTTDISTLATTALPAVLPGHVGGIPLATNLAGSGVVPALFIAADGSTNLNMAQVVPTSPVASSVGRFFRSVKARLLGVALNPVGNVETFQDDAGNPALSMTYDNIAAPSQRTTVAER